MSVTVTVGDDHVATVEFSRGPSNFFDYDLLDQIATSLEQLAADSDARAVVLCSSGAHFCAGADFSRPDEVAASMRPGRHLYDAGIRLFEQPLPVVAALHGAVVGGGLGLALAADLRVAASDARLWAPFARLGVTQGFGLSATLPRVIGQQRAQELLLSARRVGTDEAIAIGLVDRVVEPNQLRDEAHGVAASIAANAPNAVRGIRSLLRIGFVDDVRRAMAAERSLQAKHMRTSDHAEGVAASLERRQPRFTGT